MNFPRLTRATLRNFTLFGNQTELRVEFDRGVFCLAGANGLGKSTFIAALNFGLTGIVPEPGTRFKSIDDYYRSSGAFARRFFSGRIAEASRRHASIELEFSVGDQMYRVLRRPFDPKALHEFELDGKSVKARDDEHRQKLYAKSIASSVGVKTFNQFVFTQVMLLTFDEQRRLLFWEPRALERLLFQAFGVDPSHVQESDQLQREIDRRDSDVRNQKYRATVASRRLKDLEDALGGDPTAEPGLIDDWDEMHEEIEDAARRLDVLSDEIEAAKLREAELHAHESSLEQELAHSYVSMAGPDRARLASVVRQSLATAACEVCGSSGEFVRTNIEQQLHEGVCPLCSSRLTRPKKRDSAPWGRIAEDLAKATEDRAALVTEIGRKENERDEVRERLTGLTDRQREMEKSHPTLLDRALRTTATSHIEMYRLQVAEAVEGREAALAARNEARRQLGQLQASLSLRYADAERDFVPMFRSLAHSFLGIELDIRLQTRSSPVGLLLTVAESARREEHQLSESQRFFLDIALRMALADYMADGGQATLLVDTPEGSLDIAYESRAGEMFARFVASGHHIVMTANINTSNLLIRLAERCGLTRMRLVRMTGWGDLSEVQRSEESLFDDAYERIESALAAGQPIQ